MVACFLASIKSCWLVIKFSDLHDEQMAIGLAVCLESCPTFQTPSQLSSKLASLPSGKLTGWPSLFSR